MGGIINEVYGPCPGARSFEEWTNQKSEIRLYVVRAAHHRDFNGRRSLWLNIHEITDESFWSVLEESFRSARGGKLLIHHPLVTVPWSTTWT